MKVIVCNYFVDLFQKTNGGREEVINVVPRSITGEDNELLTCPFHIEEFKKAVFSMQADKSPGPDGYNPGFYQHFWELCSLDIFTAGCQWLNSGVFPPNLNSTNITLIPKGESQSSMKDWRPIALCNVLYKIVAKVLANRLKKVLSKCISNNQSAFVLDRSILDNAMAAIELVHYMKSKTRGRKGEVALKLDISKTYEILSGITSETSWARWDSRINGLVGLCFVSNGGLLSSP
jgi:hypothetical protein